MKLCTQQHPNGCVVACLAMVTGIPYKTLVQRFFKPADLEKKGVTQVHLVNILHTLNYYTRSTSAIPLKTGRGVNRGCGNYILLVPSLNIVNGSHAIVYDGNTNRVLDPNKYYTRQVGRTQETFKKVYTLTKLQQTKMYACIVVCNKNALICNK